MKSIRIDCLQYANWSKKIFQQMRQAKLDAVHVTIAYHEGFRETIQNLEKWNKMFEDYSDLIFQGFFADDVCLARKTKRTAVFFGFQNPSPIEGDIRLIEIWYRLGVRFMQLTYNNQSLLASGCYEERDTGISRMGKEVIEEMNRLGMVVDMSHSGAVSTLEAIKVSSRPIVISHANPNSWCSARRNKSDEVLTALADSGGMLGFSLYPHHLKDGSNCSLESFCTMIRDTIEVIGSDNVGIGSDLCQDQPDSVVEWMRAGNWTKKIDYGEGSPDLSGFPRMPKFFKDVRGFSNLEKGLRSVGMNKDEIDKVLGGNWLRFFKENFVTDIEKNPHPHF
ncbi:MAG: membrane dipeptidase [Pseudomonadota bacterium]|nr:membrane dipeptidase [Pseudomonadota bacterium]